MSDEELSGWTLLDMLQELQGAYPNVEFELWDQSGISERLATGPDIVSRAILAVSLSAMRASDIVEG